ncbi:MAG: glycine cleavage system aminomethyltransferase GcvT [SAR202 cluster bacterium]|nr:glycine cleavage system aminomethyltransferase GcvT [SAR202 cluster bacterium]
MSTQTLQRTALYQTHVGLKARMVPFAGWEMPVQYGSILEEARAVRTKGGLFDVSHMGRVYISGPHATDLLDWIQTGSIGSLKETRARYSLVCDEKGGIIDDTVTYRLAPDRYLLVCNASNRPAVLAWVDRWRKQKFSQTTIDDVTTKTVMIAVQGPATAALMDTLSPDKPSAMRYFSGADARVNGKKAYIGRTGYTGEDGYEVIVDAADGPGLWKTLMDKGMAACGLGSRDVLRLEAALPLHGNDIDLTTTPLEAGLERFVKLDKEFVGAGILRQQQAQGVKRKLVGLFPEGPQIPRHNYLVKVNGKDAGHITSGGYSPTLDRNIAMGYVSHEFSAPGSKIQIDIRGRLSDATVTPLPFYTRKKD